MEAGADERHLSTSTEKNVQPATLGGMGEKQLERGRVSRQQREGES